MMSVAKTAVFYLVQLTWGLPQTLVGAAMHAFVRGEKDGRCRCASGTKWKYSRGLSLGPFIFIPDYLVGADHPKTIAYMKRYQEKLLVHEYGHCIQSLVFGPLYLPRFAFPSMIWAGVPALERMRNARAFSYYRFYTEKVANWLGERVTGEESLH